MAGIETLVESPMLSFTCITSEGELLDMPCEKDIGQVSEAPN